LKKHLAGFLVVGGVGVLVGAFATYAALHPNPQGEFMDLESGRWRMGDVAMVFSAWFAAAALPAGALYALLAIVAHFVVKLSNDTQR
jgi:hypothetical protein